MNSVHYKQLNIPKNPFGVTTPLRYPGGKSAIAGFLSEVVDELSGEIDTYVEPYAGGAGAAISLLLNGKVKKIIINDYDPAVYCYWLALTRDPDRFVKKIEDTAITMDEWYRQRDIYRACDMNSKFDLGFAFFFLNRCNRSGIVKGGVIGGYRQDGEYKLTARFNKENLIKKINSIKPYRENITVLNEDGYQVFRKYMGCKNVFIYLDPPYVEQGKSLYLNSFQDEDHKMLAKHVSSSSEANWIVTYDVSDLIVSSECYAGNHIYKYSLAYSAQNKRHESEYLICSENLNEAVSKYVCEIAS